MSDASPSPNPPRSLACIGDAGDVATWSNIPYHFFHAGRAAGFLTHALDLDDPDYGKHRNRWRLATLARLQKPLGYQRSEAAGERLWSLVPPELQQGEIISHAQSFPSVRAMKNGAVVSYYLDNTLLGNAVDLRDMDDFSPAMRKRFLARERELYQAAKFVVGMSHRTAAMAVDDYGVDPAKVFVVRPGANINDDAVEAFFARTPRESWRGGEPFTNDNPAVIVFIGMDPIRKGLHKLVGAAEELGRRGRHVRVRVVGKNADDLKNHPLVEDRGVISKRTDLPRFVDAVGTAAMGSLLSTGEPLGISTLECLRLGVPVLGADTGGIPDCVPGDAGVLVSTTATAADVADAIEPRLFDPAAYANMAAAARSRSAEASWATCVGKMQQVWDGRGDVYNVRHSAEGWQELREPDAGATSWS